MPKKKPANNKRKPSIRGKSLGQPERRSWWRGLLHFMALPPVRRLILVVIMVVLLYWQWPNLRSWGTDVVDNTVGLFGWGLIFIAITIGALVGVLWRRKPSLLTRRWNYWLAGISFILAAWGILAFFDLGGSFGLGITGDPAPGLASGPVGILRVLGLVIIGLFLMAPRVSFRFVASIVSLIVASISWMGRQISRLGKQLKRRPAPRPDLPAEPISPLASVSSKSPEIEPKKEAIAPVVAPAPALEELKQVAQEVWRKYGESPSLVTIDGWRLPPIDILDRSPEVQFSPSDNVQRAKLIEEALASYGVEAKVVQINAGPTVTQFGVEPGWDRKTKTIRERDRDGNVKLRSEEVSKTRVKVDRISSLANDLALALAASSIRIEAPVPGKSVVGIEVPNTVSSVVSLRGVIETSVFQKVQGRSKLSLALGKGAGGEAIAADMTRMPHLLVAGATGSGKTVCLNSIICCLLLHNTPNDVRFVMIDPKRVELVTFNGIPHLATPVIVDTDKALEALRWLSQEMNRRYQKLAAGSARNIEGYNKSRQGDQKMPYLVLIIDELADLMMAGGDEVEQILCRLAQLARAVGIHLMVATQRPSVDVVTGLIKANFPTRISFAVTSQVDSRTILDGGGAEKLLGKGDMLYMPTEAGKPKRLQGCFVSDAEAERLVYFWGNQRREEAPSLKLDELVSSPATARRGDFPEDKLLKMARQLELEHEHISTSFLQRRLHIGYPRAARLMDQLEGELQDEGGEGKPD